MAAVFVQIRDKPVVEEAVECDKADNLVDKVEADLEEVVEVQAVQALLEQAVDEDKVVQVDKVVRGPAAEGVEIKTAADAMAAVAEMIAAEMIVGDATAEVATAEDVVVRAVEEVEWVVCLVQEEEIRRVVEVRQHARKNGRRRHSQASISIRHRKADRSIFGKFWI